MQANQAKMPAWANDATAGEINLDVPSETTCAPMPCGTAGFKQPSISASPATFCGAAWIGDT